MRLEALGVVGTGTLVAVWCGEAPAVVPPVGGVTLAGLLSGGLVVCLLLGAAAALALRRACPRVSADREVRQ